MVNIAAPDGVLNCIWVDAGIISYKLCDRDFECEGCPFDQVMRQQSRHPSEWQIQSKAGSTETESSEAESIHHGTSAAMIKKLIALSRPGTLPNGYLYSRNHLWAKQTMDGRYHVGVDGYIASLVNNVWSVILPQAGAAVRRNAPLAWLILAGGTVVVRSLMNGVVTKNNFQLREIPSLVSADPYESGWICEVSERSLREARIPSVTEQKNIKSDWLDEKAAKIFYDDQFVQLERKLISESEQRQAAVGTTMMDGGVRPRTLEDILGSQRHILLLKELLSADV